MDDFTQTDLTQEIDLTLTDDPTREQHGTTSSTDGIVHEVPALTEQKHVKKQKKEPGEFRITYKKMALTYSQCNEDIKDFVTAFEGKITERGLGFNGLRIAKEEHKEGGYHFHVAYTSIKKPDIKNPRYLDLVINGKTYHPNIRKQYSSYWTELYIQVDAPTHPERIYERGDNEFHPMAYAHGRRQKVYEDMLWTQSFLKRKVLKDVTWPISIEFTGRQAIIIPEPRATEKRRHLWIHGPPDLGKTFFTEEAFEGMKVFFPAKSNSYDAYLGEQVIIYDDIYPTLHHLMSGTNTSKFEKACGDTRYKHVYWPANQCRLIIVLCNESIDTVYCQAKSNTLDAVKARFIEYNFN